MSDFDITAEDIVWLNQNFPKLRFRKEEDGPSITGLLEFGMDYEPGKPYKVYPFRSNVKSTKNLIFDAFQITITPEKGDSGKYPLVDEIGGRINKDASRHFNENGSKSFCLSSKLEERNFSKFELQSFFLETLIPFFYAQSYFEKNNVWPWGEYAHGLAGTLESYKKVGDNIAFRKKVELYKEVISNQLLIFYFKKQIEPSNFMCICGSGKRFINCHPEAFKGLEKLRDFFTTPVYREIFFACCGDCVLLDRREKS
ncbi:MAG: hypothetical protein WC437_02720 [Patescibacteria group bacterium]